MSAKKRAETTYTLRLEVKHPFLNDIRNSDRSIKVEDKFEQEGSSSYTYKIDLKFTPKTGEYVSPVLEFFFDSEKQTHEVKAVDGLSAGIVYCDSPDPDMEPSKLAVLANSGGLALLVTEEGKPVWKPGGGDALFGVKDGAWYWGEIQDCE